MKKFVLTLLLLCIACKNVDNENLSSKTNEIAFDKAKWQMRDGESFVFRDQMLDSLIASDTLKKLKKEEILNLLGEPTRIDSSYLFYRISDETMGFLTLHAKSMVIKLNDDGSVNWVKIHE